MAIDEQAKLLEFSRILKERGVDPSLFNDMWREQEAFEGMGGQGWYFDNVEEAANQPPPGGANPAGGGAGGPMPDMGPNALENQPPHDMPDKARHQMGLPPKMTPEEGLRQKQNPAFAPLEFPPLEPGDPGFKEGEGLDAPFEPTPEEAAAPAPAPAHQEPGNLGGFFPNKEARGILNEPLQLNEFRFQNPIEGQAMPDHTFRQELRHGPGADRGGPLSDQGKEAQELKKAAEERRRRHRRFK